MLTRNLNVDNMLEVSHFREVAAFRLADGYIGPHIHLAFAVEFFPYTEEAHYREVWCGVIWC
jgi:hypothetical protein